MTRAAALRSLWLTNDLPPRPGGIQQFVANLLRRTDPDGAIVIGPADPAAASHDPTEPFRTIRSRRAVIFPSPRTVRLVERVAREHEPDVVVLGATWPLGELARGLGLSLRTPVVALTHGHEAGIATVGLGFLIRRATRGLAAVTTISDYTESVLGPHLAAERVARVPPGVDVDAFRPGLDATELRARWGVPDGATLVGCVSRLVQRKGQDVLVAAWAEVRRRHPDAWLALVGAGPLEARVREQVARMGPNPQVVMTGAVAWSELARAHAALDVFAMPCRTRLRGVDVEGLGIVYLEAQACGVPVVAGRSGGAPEAVRDGETGHVVDGTSPGAVAEALVALLDDPHRRAAMGEAGRRWVEENWSWEATSARFRAVLDDVVAASPS